MKRGPYVALSATFMDDPAVIEAGEKAGWLYLAMACDCRLRRTDGTIAKHRLERLGVSGWKARIGRLLAVGLVEEGDGVYLLPGYLKWNKAEGEYQRSQALGKVSACRRHHAAPCNRPDCAAAKNWLEERGISHG